MQCCAVIGAPIIDVGCSGAFVSRLHSALLTLGDQPIDGSDLAMAFFGLSSARAAAAWKRERLLPPRPERRAHVRYRDARLHVGPPAIDGRIDRATILQLDDDMAALERRGRSAGIPA